MSFDNEYFYNDDASPDGNDDPEFDGMYGEELNIFDHEELVLDPLTSDINVTQIKNQQRRIENNLAMGEVEGIQMGILTHDDIIDESVFLVMNTANINSGFLGARKHVNCNYCNHPDITCKGHRGHMLLPFTPNPLYLSTASAILSMFCSNCSIFRLQGPRAPGTTFSVLATSVRNKKCYNCGAGSDSPILVFPPPVNTKGTGGRRAESKRGQRIVQFEQAYDLFLKITPEQHAFLNIGDNHVTSMLMRSLPIMPYPMRPQQIDDEQVLTRHIENLYEDFVKAVSDLVAKMANSIKDYVGPEDTLYSDLMGLIDKDMPKDTMYELRVTPVIEMIRMYNPNPAKAAAEIQSIYESVNVNIPLAYHNLIHGKTSTGKIQMVGIKDKIQSKEGYIRNNIMGRRTNQVARTVAAPGGNLNVDEIGMPVYSRSNLSVPITVRDYNMDALALLLVNGDIINVRKSRDDGSYSNVNISITNRDSFKLTIGDICDRRLDNGDVILVNRQPTLNKQSYIQGFARIIQDKVLRINLSLTSPMNADFDGDELNIHVPQGVEARVEARLFSVTNNFINESNNGAMFGIVYNTLAGCYSMTNNGNTEENRKLYRRVQSDENAAKIGYIPEHATILQHAIDRAYMNADAIVNLKARCEQQGQVWGTGHSILSLAFPAGFWYKSKMIEIRDGILMHGIVDSREIGTGNHVMNNIVQPKVILEMHARFRSHLLRMMSVLQFVSNAYFKYHAFSVNYFDCISIAPSFRESTLKLVEKAQTSMRQILAHTARTPAEIADQEDLIINLMNMAGAVPSNFNDIFTQNTALQVMASSGAKGNKRNLTQMTFGLGCQRLNGKLIPAALPGGRTIPTYDASVPTLEDRGFVLHSFSEGLSCIELFMHSVSNRESLVDTSIGTQTTGTFNHDNNKSLENVVTDNEGAVISLNNNRISSYVYAGHGFRPAGLVNVPGPSNSTNVATFVNVKSIMHQLNSAYAANNGLVYA